MTRPGVCLLPLCVKSRDADQPLIYHQSQLDRTRFGKDRATGFHGKQTGY
jgi:hypothetical protein